MAQAWPTEGALPVASGDFLTFHLCQVGWINELTHRTKCTRISQYEGHPDFLPPNAAKPRATIYLQTQREGVGVGSGTQCLLQNALTFQLTVKAMG